MLATRFLFSVSISLIATALTFLGDDSARQKEGATLEVGKQAPDFELKTTGNESFQLSDFRDKAPVVIVVLRGYPGYQCPLCSRQVQDWIDSSAKIPDEVRVVFIYPGPEKQIREKAKEFFASTQLPPGFTVLLDPGYRFADNYGLRWDAPSETAYPSTIVVDKKGVLRFLSVSKSHGDRVPAKQILADLKKLD